MSLNLPDEKRRARDLLRRQIAELESPEREAARKARQVQRKARGKALGLSVGQRRERQRDNPFLAWTRRQPCTVAHLGGCDGHVDAAHLRFGDAKYGRVNPGMGRKPDDRWVLSLCRTHHSAQHAAGNERAWWAGTGIDPNEECIRKYNEFKGKSS